MSGAVARVLPSSRESKLFERPRAGERAVLVRLGIGAPADPEDIQEFEQLARSAGAIPVAEHRRPARSSRSALLRGQWQGGRDPRRRGRTQRRRGAVRSSAVAVAGAQSRETHRAPRARSLGTDPRHLRAARAQPRRQARSRARAAQAHRHRAWCAAGPTSSVSAVAASATAVLAKHSSKPTAVCSASASRRSTARLEKIKQQRETGRQQRAEIPDSFARAGGLHQRRQVHAVPRAHRRRCLRGRPVVRDARSHGATASCCRATRTVVVADTVGFIRELPHELVAAFQSTLTEAREATLLLHVVDVSDPRRDEHIDEVNRVLAEIGAADLPQILVFNKIDRIDTPPRVERNEAGQREPRVAVGGPGRRGSICCAKRWPNAWRASRAVRRCACRSRPASCGRGCMRPAWCAPSGSPMTAPSRSTLNYPNSSCSNGRASPASKFWRSQTTQLVRPQVPTYNRRPPCEVS